MDPSCHWCARPVRLVAQVRGSKTPDDMATLEHIIPECQGGQGESNMALACRRCNSMRSNYSTLAEALLVYIESGEVRLARLIDAPPAPFQDHAIRKTERKLREHRLLFADIS